MDMTAFERATIRLRAWELPDGWGVHDSKHEFRKWTNEERKDAALKLADWASAEPEKQNTETS